jgi:3-phosphoshikimate 1-carboxyvinyltransferase
MVDSLQRLGLQVDHATRRQQIRVTGSSGTFPNADVELFVGNSGTTIRFLTAMLSTCHGRFRLDGVERMRQRPIGDLIDTLRQLGARIDCEAKPNCPPVVIIANGLNGGRADIKGNISSQFLSGLLMAAPYAQHDVDLFVEGDLVSQPYVTMTLRVMSAFGVQIDGSNLHRFQVAAGQRYQACDYEIEPDASAASYFWAAAAITGGRVTVRGLTRHSLQGDVAF